MRHLNRGSDIQDFRSSGVRVSAIAGVAVLTAPLLRLVPALQESRVTGAALFALGAGTLAALSLIPMHLLAILAGWTLALVPGLPVVFAGLLAAAALGYILSALLAGRRVIDLIGTHPEGRAVHEALLAAGGAVHRSLTHLDLRAPEESWPAAFGIAATILAVVVIGRMAARALRRFSAHG